MQAPAALCNEARPERTSVVVVGADSGCVAGLCRVLGATVTRAHVTVLIQKDSPMPVRRSDICYLIAAYTPVAT